jgi:hypothetical protein
MTEDKTLALRQRLADAEARGKSVVIYSLEEFEALLRLLVWGE